MDASVASDANANVNVGINYLGVDVSGGTRIDADVDSDAG